jgi:7-keto-8-aminopelargonate synthetase-like enzyme
MLLLCPGWVGVWDGKRRLVLHALGAAGLLAEHGIEIPLVERRGRIRFSIAADASRDEIDLLLSALAR